LSVVPLPVPPSLGQGQFWLFVVVVKPKMPFRGGPVNNPTIFVDECAAADVPSIPLCTVQAVPPVPPSAVTNMISDSTRIRNEALGKSGRGAGEEGTVREV